MSQNQIPQEETKNNKNDISYKVMTPSVKKTLAIDLSNNLALTAVQMKNYPSSVNRLRLQENLKLKNYSNNTPKFDLLNSKSSSEIKSNNLETHNTPLKNTLNSKIKNDKEESKNSKRSKKENLSSSKMKENSLLIHQEQKQEQEIEQELRLPVTNLTKRKFNEIFNEKEEAKKSNEDLIRKINILYENYSNNNDIVEINDFFQNYISKLLNLSKFIPESSCMRGKLLLESSKFSILYFHYLCHSTGIFTILKLENFIQLMDYFLMYDQNELKLLYNFFKSYVLKNYNKEEIKNMIIRKEEDFIFDEVDYENQIKYLLSKKDSFVFAEAEEEAVASKKFKSKRKDISNFNFFKTNKMILSNKKLVQETENKEVLIENKEKEIIIKKDELVNEENIQTKIEKLLLNEEEVINFSIFGEQKINIFEIQNSSICFKHEKAINVNNFKMMDQVKFTILPNLPAEPIQEPKQRANSSKKNDEMEISEEFEEKTAQNIGSSNKNNKNKSVKNKKRYQSDIKAEKKPEPLEEEEEVNDINKQNIKARKAKTKNKKPTEENNKKKQNDKSEEEIAAVSVNKNKKNRRGRSSNVKSNSEPESEIELKKDTRNKAAANKTKNEKKLRGRSKK